MTAQSYTVTKTFTGFSTAHRLWRAPSHCKYVHGYDRSFDITFGCLELDGNGWVIDFGGLKPLKARLAELYDHRLLVSTDDPLRRLFEQLDRAGGAAIRFVDHPGMEGAAAEVFHEATYWASKETKGRVVVVSVVARENDRNAVAYTGPGPEAELPCPPAEEQNAAVELTTGFCSGCEEDATMIAGHAYCVRCDVPNRGVCMAKGLCIDCGNAKNLSDVGDLLEIERCTRCARLHGHHLQGR